MSLRQHWFDAHHKLRKSQAMRQADRNKVVPLHRPSRICSTLPATFDSYYHDANPSFALALARTTWHSLNASRAAALSALAPG